MWDKNSTTEHKICPNCGAKKHKLKACPNCSLQENQTLAELKERINKTIQKNQKKHTKTVPKKTTPIIDFDKPKKTIKGISICDKCKAPHLECKKCFMDNGEQLLFCKKCYLIQHEKYLLKKNDSRVNKMDIFDLNNRISGCYGSGKKR